MLMLFAMGKVVHFSGTCLWGFGILWLLLLAINSGMHVLFAPRIVPALVAFTVRMLLLVATIAIALALSVVLAIVYVPFGMLTFFDVLVGVLFALGEPMLSAMGALVPFTLGLHVLSAVAISMHTLVSLANTVVATALAAVLGNLLSTALLLYRAIRCCASFSGFVVLTADCTIRPLLCVCPRVVIRHVARRGLVEGSDAESRYRRRRGYANYY